MNYVCLHFILMQMSLTHQESSQTCALIIKFSHLFIFGILPTSVIKNTEVYTYLVLWWGNICQGRKRFLSKGIKLTYLNWEANTLEVLWKTIERRGWKQEDWGGGLDSNPGKKGRAQKQGRVGTDLKWYTWETLHLSKFRL